MTPTTPRPSEQILLQRVRNQLIDYLEVAASFRAQREYQDQSPQLHVAVEIIEQWADWVSPEWHAQFVAPVFSEVERQAIADYQAKWDALRRCLPEPMPPLLEMHKDPLWEELRKAASAAYACFVRVGKMSESEEYRPTPAGACTSPAMGVLIYAKHLDTLAQFYSDVLQLAEEPSQSDAQYGLLALQGRGIHLLLHAIPVHYAEDIVITVPPQPREESALKFFCYVHDLAHTLNLIQELGGVCLGSTQQTSTYLYRDALDLEGNVFQVRTSLATPRV